MASLGLRRETGITSRDWEVSKKHVGLYSGGKLALFSPEGRDVLACLYGEDVSFVDIISGQVLATLQGKEDDELNKEGAELAREVITTFCVNQRKSELVTASRNMMIRHWSVQFNFDDDENSEPTMRCIRTLKGHTEPILCMDYDPSGVFVATGSADRTARVWDMRGGFATHNFRGHGGLVSLVKFHPDPKKLLLITACDDCATRIWSLYDKSCVATLGNHMSVVTSVAFSGDGNTMVTGSRDKVVNFWELRRNTLMKTLPVYEEVEGLCIVHGEGEESNVGGGEDEEGAGQSRKKSKKSKKDQGSKKKMVEDASGTLVVIGSKGIARSWKFEAKDHLELAEQSRKGGRDDLLACYEFAKQVSASAIPSAYTSLIHISGRYPTSDGGAADNEEQEAESTASALSNELIICATADHNINFMDPYQLETKRKIVGYFDEVNTVKYLNDGSSNKLAVATNSDQLKILKIDDFSCEVCEGHQGTIITLDVCPNGKYVITGSKDRTARLWDIESSLNKCAMVCVGHTQAVSAVALSRKPKAYEAGESFFFTASSDKTLKKWKLDERKLSNDEQVAALSQDDAYTPIQPHAVGNIRAHEKDINHLCVSPNDGVVVSSSQDKTAKIWSTGDLSLVGTLKGHKRGIMQSCFSPANKTIATASGDRTVKVWSLVDYACLNTLQGHSGSVCQVAYLNKYGLQLASTGSDGLLKIWTIKTGECESTFDAHDDKVWALTVSPATLCGESTPGHAAAGGQLVTGGADSVVKVWKDVTKEKEDELILESESKILKEQELMMSLHNKDYSQAIDYAFELNHSYKLWNIFSEVMEQENGASELKKLIVQFDDDRLVKCLGFVREWNTNANKSFVAQHILSCILNGIDFTRLKKIPTLLDLINGLIPYTERHFNRVDRLAQASFLIDYSCSVMSSIQEGGEFGKMEDVRNI